MKVGIALTGISYNDQIVPGTNWGRKRDWREAYYSMQDNIISFLDYTNAQYSYYLYSYDNPQKDEIMKAYLPKKATWLPSYEGTTMATTFLDGLCQLLKEDLDMIIATRFDIVFLENIMTRSTWDYNKFNFLFWEQGWRQYKFTTDTFYMFPAKYLDRVIYSLADMIKNSPPPKNIGMHNLYTPLAIRIGKENINIVCGEEEHLSHTNTLFTLTREE